jgi:LCP family protein required for cell wall assembly
MTTAPMSRRPSAGAILGGLVALAIVAIVAFVLLSSRGNGPAASGSPHPSLAETPVASASLDEALLSHRYTVLLVGKDTNAGRAASDQPVNTDALMVVSINADQSQVVMLGLPRDVVDLPMADGSTWAQKVNGIYRAQVIDALVGAMKTLYDLPIDAYAAIDMDDLPKLVDAVGGVEVDVPERLVDGHLGLDLPAGAQTLDGATALDFVRTRLDTDYHRVARHQELVASLVAALTGDRAIDLPALIDTLSGLQTDLPLSDLPTLVELARRAATAEQVRKVFDRPDFITYEGDRGDGRGYILEPDIAAIRAYVAATITD